jgi:hypothetical protein
MIYYKYMKYFCFISFFIFFLLPEKNNCVLEPVVLSSLDKKNNIIKIDPKIESPDPFTMGPWPSEALATPISLKDCPGIQIIEWRTSFGEEISQKAINVLNDTCKKVLEAFPKFTSKINIRYNLSDFKESICLMPYQKDQYGLEVRNLNDSVFRFKNREKTYDSNGKLNLIWGYTDIKSKTIFVRNFVLTEDGLVNNNFVKVFSHELYHALAWTFHIYDNIRGNLFIYDENMALNFTKFMGFER